MEQPSRLLQQPRFIAHVGSENIVLNIQAALDRALALDALHHGALAS
jgi:hypothetical protein